MFNPAAMFPPTWRLRDDCREPRRGCGVLQVRVCDSRTARGPRGRLEGTLSDWTGGRRTSELSARGADTSQPPECGLSSKTALRGPERFLGC